MAASPAHGPASGPGPLALFDRLTQSLPWRLNVRPFPVLILEPGEDGAPEERFLDAFKRSATELGLPSVSPAPGSAPREANAVDLVDAMAQPLKWNHPQPHFVRFRFPRSALVASIEEAGGRPREVGAPVLPCRRSPVAAVQAWNAAAGLFDRRGGPFGVQPWWPAIGALLAVVAGGIAEQSSRRSLVAAAACIAAALLVLAALSTRRIWLPVVSHVGFGSRYRWLASSSFFGVLGESGVDEQGGGVQGGFEDRLHRVFERLSEDDAAGFLLQLKTFALLEDVRDNYRKASFGLRGFKRTAPPVAFLAGITPDNGGFDVVTALSDIRSRRSELHPLLVIASVGRDSVAALDALTQSPDGRLAPQVRYERWRTSLGTAQGPSQEVALPWLLRVPVAGDPAGGDAPAPRVRRRPRWTWVWSVRSLAASVLVFAAAATYVQSDLRSTYCTVGLPFTWNADTRLQTNDNGTRECVGVSTGGVRFERRAKSIGLDGRDHVPSGSNTGASLTLADLQSRIKSENDAVARSGEPYVTIVHAGVFTASAGQGELTLSSVRELAGAYLAQLRTNRVELGAGTGSP
ncbi:hypothetical protein ACFQHO_04020 [Actinomadura yumaensis]|nr:hypothetical protein [Actinomadura sp. J1-007]MWK38004.1 hypothetical protein [Actinomadura sp. J1-007]